MRKPPMRRFGYESKIDADAARRTMPEWYALSMNTDDLISEQALKAWNDKFPERVLTIDLCRLRWESDSQAIVDYLDGKIIGHAFVSVDPADQEIVLSGPFDGAPPR